MLEYLFSLPITSCSPLEHGVAENVVRLWRLYVGRVHLTRASVVPVLVSDEAELWNALGSELVPLFSPDSSVCLGGILHI